MCERGIGAYNTTVLAEAPLPIEIDIAREQFERAYEVEGMPGEARPIKSPRGELSNGEHKTIAVLELHNMSICRRYSSFQTSRLGK